MIYKIQIYKSLQKMVGKWQNRGADEGIWRLTTKRRWGTGGTGRGGPVGGTPEHGKWRRSSDGRGGPGRGGHGQRRCDGPMFIGWQTR